VNAHAAGTPPGRHAASAATDVYGAPAGRPRIGSLCTGYGGLDLAVELVLGGQVAWYAETDPHARTVLAHHWPGVANLGDIRTIDWTGVEPVEILTAGFPCQDISNAGKRAGITGEHSSVWSAVADAVRALRPPLVYVENVAALLHRGFDVVQADLAEIGYDTRWLCLRASDIGAAHRRDRLFLLAADQRRLGAGTDPANPVRP
jgi:DNA (cytosine-5)-methyltransferase 1